MPTSIPKLPSVANSIAGLEFIGFTHATATHIFSTYSKYKLPSTIPSADNEDFFSFIHGHIIMINSSKFAGSTDRETMTNLGISEDVQNRILDPKFEGVRGTGSLEYWIEDTARVNYFTLVRMIERKKESEQGL
ncbi:hypothetical protein KCU71_g17268, partial [Aureobasidium melanogenum]